MKVKNYMEDVVDNLIPVLLKEFTNICTCERCVADIKALALNNLKPKYVATVEGEVYTKVNELSVQFEADSISAIVDAINKVTKSPRHF
ncbi:late competence development ComFB family protein [Alkaliphilus pronyensis]|uniref:Late competence development ComFB family protein n=1 Tax=Alkaliphilus pronyensis TaxID=1482732 RepID=A0A6I0F4D7_9FIRM|nr:late competence development ComFB family protein [Alkaliphilus pronyensis]KAB3537370.1 late competence development ComFB family protein [Alkaliphilus pronyensis]